MSAQIISFPERRPPPSPGGPVLRPAIQPLLDRLSSHFGKKPDFVPAPTGFAFDNGVGRTRVSIEPVDFPTPDGYRVTEIGEVRTELRDSLQEITDLEMAVFNTLASLGALLRDPDSLVSGCVTHRHPCLH